MGPASPFVFYRGLEINTKGMPVPALQEIRTCTACKPYFCNQTNDLAMIIRNWGKLGPLISTWKKEYSEALIEQRHQLRPGN
jgi:hypothetical protein